MRILLVFGFLVVWTAYSFAQDDVSIDCAAFQKQPDGTYRVVAPTIVKVGSSVTILSTSVIGPQSGSQSTKASAEVYDAIENKCGETQGQARP
jgi:hypothetical protein